MVYCKDEEIKTQGSEKMKLQHVKTEKTVAFASIQASTDQWTFQTDVFSCAHHCSCIEKEQETQENEPEKYNRGWSIFGWAAVSNILTYKPSL